MVPRKRLNPTLRLFDSPGSHELAPPPALSIMRSWCSPSRVLPIVGATDSKSALDGSAPGAPALRRAEGVHALAGKEYVVHRFYSWLGTRAADPQSSSAGKDHRTKTHRRCPRKRFSTTSYPPR
jgi:hypothetical protein